MRETAKEAGLTADQIAEVVGKTPGAVRHWWIARNEPSFDDLELYGRAVGRSAYYLLTGQDDPAVLLREIENRLAEFSQKLTDGAEPVAAIQLAGGDLTALSETERDELSAAGPTLREYLASSGGQAWLSLSETERQMVLRLVWDLARARPERPEPR
jgi:transcriptional regulator with XRE-family HTH domain